MGIDQLLVHVSLKTQQEARPTLGSSPPPAPPPPGLCPAPLFYATGYCVERCPWGSTRSQLWVQALDCTMTAWSPSACSGEKLCQFWLSQVYGSYCGFIVSSTAEKGLLCGDPHPLG